MQSSVFCVFCVCTQTTANCSWRDCYWRVIVNRICYFSQRLLLFDCTKRKMCPSSRNDVVGGRPLRGKFSTVFSERERTFTFAICYRPSVCLSSVCNVRAPYTQPVEIYGNVSSLFGTLAIRWHSLKILQISSQGNPPPSGGELNARG